MILYIIIIVISFGYNLNFLFYNEKIKWVDKSILILWIISGTICAFLPDQLIDRYNFNSLLSGFAFIFSVITFLIERSNEKEFWYNNMHRILFLLTIFILYIGIEFAVREFPRYFNESFREIPLIRKLYPLFISLYFIITALSMFKISKIVKEKRWNKNTEKTYLSIIYFSFVLITIYIFTMYFNYKLYNNNIISLIGSSFINSALITQFFATFYTAKDINKTKQKEYKKESMILIFITIVIFLLIGGIHTVTSFIYILNFNNFDYMSLIIGFLIIPLFTIFAKKFINSEYKITKP